ncbi:MAG: alpha/beta fold hydrolase [Moraxellaceae bacterium]
MKKLAWTAVIAVAVVAGLFVGRDYFGITDIPAAELREKYGADAYFVDVLGTQVRVKESGRGETLLLLHGFAASADTWDGWRARLSPHFRVIAVDMAPFAVTGPLPDRTMSPAELQNFMDALVQRLGLSQFYLGGNSLGGYVSWNYALRHPDQVKKLILVDSAGYPMPAPLPVTLMKTPVLRDITAHFSPRFIVAQSVRDVYGHPENVTDAQIQRYHDMMRREGARPAVSDLVSRLDFNAAGITELKVPTLILWGDKDKWIPPEHAASFHRDIAGSQLIMYEGLGHIPMEEDPARTSLDAARFLLGAVPVPGAPAVSAPL